MLLSTNENINLEKLESSTLRKICAVCENETSGAHKCSKCVHVICGDRDKNKGFDVNLNSNVQEKDHQYCKRICEIRPLRFSQVEIVSKILVKMPEVDRGRVARRNVFAVNMSIHVSGFFQLGSQEGLFDRLYARNTFTISDTNFINRAYPPLR